MKSKTLTVGIIALIVMIFGGYKMLKPAPLSVVRHWTAPYSIEDDSTSGRCDRYDLRWTQTDSTFSNWNSDHAVPNMVAPGNPGSLDSAVVLGVPLGTTYWAIKSGKIYTDGRDSVIVWSDISNIFRERIVKKPKPVSNLR